MRTMRSIEKPPTTSSEKSSDEQGKEVTKLTEEDAENRLTELLEDPQNSFLLSISRNKEFIENAPTANEALSFAQEQIKRRLEKNTQFRFTPETTSFEVGSLNVEGLRANVEIILDDAIEIGRGGDGFVVIDKNEIEKLPPEICYKFMLQESTPRGRNSTTRETELQEAFYAAVKNIPESKIGIPVPFYSLEVGNHKVIAMEKLNALSVEDILRGKGHIPEWLNIDELCTELTQVLDYLHSVGLYHRDLHLGNIMISQKTTYKEGDKIAFIIDFGLSAENHSGIEPYKSVFAGVTFTYNDDYGTIKNLQKELSSKRHGDAHDTN